MNLGLSVDRDTLISLGATRLNDGFDKAIGARPIANRPQRCQLVHLALKRRVPFSGDQRAAEGLLSILPRLFQKDVAAKAGTQINEPTEGREGECPAKNGSNRTAPCTLDHPQFGLGASKASMTCDGNGRHFFRSSLRAAFWRTPSQRSQLGATASRVRIHFSLARKQRLLVQFFKPLSRELLENVLCNAILF